jgi:aminoglycoside phosphotransferase (APT) family kinase protein
MQPMTTPFERIVQRLHPLATLVRATKLHGGISAETFALEIELPDGRMQKLIVRRQGDAYRDRPDAHIPVALEHALLRALKAEGLPVPEPLFHDDSCEDLPTPFIVMEYVEGEPDFAPSDALANARQMAEVLARIHAVDFSTHRLSSLPSLSDEVSRKIAARPERLDDSISEGEIRGILMANWPLHQRNRDALLHGDFWPGNILWRSGRVAAVIDWEDAMLGDPLSDIANARLEILWAYGADAMRAFTDHYQALTGIDKANLPFWDLRAAIRPAFKIPLFAETPATERTLRQQHHWFVSQARDAMQH